MKSKPDKIRTIIVGAGRAGRLLANNISGSDVSGFEIIGFIDDEPSKQGKLVAGARVLGKTTEVRQIVIDNQVEELLVAIPSGRGEILRKLIKETTGLKVGYKILPRLTEVLRQNFDEDFIKYVRNVLPEDMLGGEILKSDQEDIVKYTRKQTIMITGAAGSIGSELARQAVTYGAKKVIVYDWWENGIFELRSQISETHSNASVVYVIGDIKDRKKLSHVMAEHKPTTVFHAAAYKHVPLMEEQPAESIINNIIGTRNVAEIAINHRVNKFILISTDKAVNPTNVMGATKRAAEKMINILSQSQSHTTMCAVRFGNVINSNGSAIPFFEKQIAKGGPVTVTHEDMTRFFMTIPEAVHLILQAWIMGENNDLFVLDMGESIRIYELAELLIALNGYIPGEEIKITIVGLRPGEKLFEELLVKEEEVTSTAVNKVFRTKNHHNFNELAFLYNLDRLLEAIEIDSIETKPLKKILRQIVSTYKPSKNY